MSVSRLSPSVLPLFPSTFAEGDLLTTSTCTLERLASGQWACESCESPTVAITDAVVRRRFTVPEILHAFGVPLFTPAHVYVDEPLPGRPISAGENPFERDRPYLVCSTRQGGFISAVVNREPSTWGPVQVAVTVNGSTAADEMLAAGREISLAETGTVFVRQPGIALTLAYVPADDPTVAEADALIEYAVLRAVDALF
ncbi:hypothetical protein ACIQ9R_36200 [Streptomyces sp. NPDC094447]|uniref:hypothetical protein n=1 Tax=Streptomyces sp. NPDC094447 TaxID=3366062 RepID=UPI003830883D